MKWNPETLEGSPICQLGEGPVWLDGQLHWVDIEGHVVWRWKGEGSGSPEIVYQAEDTVGCIVPRRSGGWVAGVGRAVILLDRDWNEEGRLALDFLEANERINDGKADPSGRLWIGTMDRAAKLGVGKLLRIGAGEQIRVMLEGCGISNGLDWSADEKTFYFIDSLRGDVRAFPYDRETGDLGTPDVLARIPDATGTPDGMTLDDQGRLWVALFGGHGLVTVETGTGVVGAVLPMSALNVTCPTLTPEGTLYATTAVIGLTDEQRSMYPESGRVFEVADVGARSVRATSAVDW